MTHADLKNFISQLDPNLTKNEQYQAEPFPEFIKDIINSDGLMNSLKK